MTLQKFHIWESMGGRGKVARVVEYEQIDKNCGKKVAALFRPCISKMQLDELLERNRARRPHFVV